MSHTIAKPIIKNKFWIVESSGEKIATIQATDSGEVVFVDSETRQRFPSITSLKKTYGIKIARYERRVDKEHTINGFPTAGNPHNILWDVQRKLPIYTKNSKSKSFYCAGYYVVKLNKVWTKMYCPKFITVSRYEFKGPFKTQKEMNTRHEELNNG
jgi:hypothetical protein